MKTTFNLVDEPWLPCELPGGRRAELGLREALARAHEIVGIVDSSPLVTVCIHRMLLAIVHRVVDGPRSSAAWSDAYAAGRLDEARLSAYLDKWHARFDLFHPERPFMQVRGLPFEPDEADMLIEHRTRWGGGRELFEHRPESESTRLPPAEAARGLLVMHAYSAGGLVRKPGEPTSATASPLRAGLQALVLGSTLFESLLLNLLIYDPAKGRPFASAHKNASDAPSWELEPQPQRLAMTKEPVNQPRGWLELLTWQSRRLELHRDAAGMVSGVVRAVGQGLELPENIVDPFVLRKQTDKGVITVGLNPERAVWRDLTSLVRSTSAEFDRLRPLNVAELYSDTAPKETGRAHVPPMSLFGLAGDQARVEMVRAETFPLPRAVLEDPHSGETMRELMKLSDGVSFDVRSALRVLAAHSLRASGNADKDDISKLVDALGAERPFWERLRPAFDQLLGSGISVEGAAAYRTAIRMTAEKTVEHAAASLGTAGRHLAAAVPAHAYLYKNLVEKGLVAVKATPAKEVTP